MTTLIIVQGLGITVFGIAYMFVHDGLVHKRFPVGPIADVPYFRRVASAHKVSSTSTLPFLSDNFVISALVSRVTLHFENHSPFTSSKFQGVKLHLPISLENNFQNFMIVHLFY